MLCCPFRRSQGERCWRSCSTSGGGTHGGRLCDVFWPELDEATARRRLSYALWTVTQAVGADLIRRDGDRLSLDYAQVDTVDVHAFEGALAQEGSVSALHAAVDLYTAPLLADDYSDWVIAEQERLRERYLAALQRLVAAYKAAQEYDAAFQTALTLIQADPLREDAYQEAMRLCHILGRPHEAERLYTQLASTLRAELDATPTEQTTSLRQTGSVVLPQKTQKAPFEQAPPLIGRTAERHTLLDQLGRAVQGYGGVVFVAGEPGVGKSRLLTALAEDASWRGVVVMQGRAQELTADAPYGLLLATLQDGLSPLRAQQAATLLDRLWLSAAATVLPALADWTQGVSTLPAMKPDQERIRLMEGLVRLILALAEANPLLLILDDLHWADAATLDVLIYLAQRLRAARVLAVFAFRQVDAQQNAPAWAAIEAIDRTGVLARLALAPLSVEETAEMVQHTLVLPAPATLFATRIHAETGGNPLFVLESLRTLYAEGLLRQDEAGNWTTPFDADTEDYAELPLLPAVEETISRRLARLDDVARRLLINAAVVGREISLFALAELTDLDGRDLLPAVGRLVQQGLLQETATGYRFGHDVVRETVYAGLGEDERRALHRRVLGALGDDGSAAALAYHGERAGLDADAARHYAAAGEAAATVHAYRQALQHFDSAERLLGEGEAIPARLLFARERVLDVLGLRERQQADLERLAALTTADPKQQIALERRYGQMLAALGDYAAARARLDRALALARRGGDSPEIASLQAQILAAAGEMAYWNGAGDAALPLLEEAIALSQAHGEIATEAEAESTLSAALVLLGRYDEALAAADRSTARYRAVGDRVGEADVLSAVGAILSEQGDVAGAEQGYAEALAIHREVGYRYGEARTLINWGVVCYMQGKAGAALTHFAAASQIAQEIDSQRAWSFAEISVAAVISTYVGDTARGRQAIEGVLAVQRAQGNKTLLAQALSIQAQFDYLAGDRAAALAHMDEALTVLADAAEMPFLLAQIHQARSLALHRVGRAEDALAAVEAALALHAAHNLGDLAVGFLTHKAQILRQLGRLSAAAEAIHAAVDALTPGVAQPYLVHFEHHNVLQAMGRTGEAQAALVTAHGALVRMLETLSTEDQAISCTGIPEHAAILAAWAATQATKITLLLPRAGAPTGRPLRQDEQITVAWTVETPDDRAIASKTRRRRGQIVRLLYEAREQGAVPAYRHLAEALGVSERTIIRDMVVLGEEIADLPRTRGDW
ncbi:MAG: AAA family ATPase [Caldilineaceae bacterium]